MNTTPKEYLAPKIYKEQFAHYLASGGYLPHCRSEMQAVEQLQHYLRETEDLRSISNILSWDQATFMPEKGAGTRARQLAMLGKMAHQRSLAEQLKTLVDKADALPEKDDRTRALIESARRSMERSSRVPAELVGEIKEHTAKTYIAWTKARPNNDFASLAPLLKKSVEYSLRFAEYFPEAAHPIDVFIDEYDRGMSAKRVRSLFADLRTELVPLAQSIFDKNIEQADFVSRAVSSEKQMAFANVIAERLGYDFSRGRQDLTHHPFMIRFAAGDIRITTRIKEDDITEALFSTIHETGHALYELGISPELDGLPIANGVSAGIHESQSRLWENQIGRSLAFWKGNYAALKEAYSPVLDDVSVEDFHRAINHVRPGLIRTDADEVTYNLHVMIRFDLEMAMLEGKLKIEDLPEAWNARMQSDLGILPDCLGNGVLQDVHWFCEPIGGTFQGYTIGNLFAAQVLEEARKEIQDLDERTEKGDYHTLRTWLGDRIYQHGAIYQPDELIQRSTGKALSHESFMRYLRSKYGALYGALD